MIDEDDTSDEESLNSPKSEDSEHIVAFDIDSKVKDGRVALLYRENHSKPQIWF